MSSKLRDCIYSCFIALIIVAAVWLLAAGVAKLNQQITAETKRDQALVSTKNAIGTNIKELESWAESLSNATGIEDEAIITAHGIARYFYSLDGTSMRKKNEF
jgi:cell division protein FtsB